MRQMRIKATRTKSRKILWRTSNRLNYPQLSKQPLHFPPLPVTWSHLHPRSAPSSFQLTYLVQCGKQSPPAPFPRSLSHWRSPRQQAAGKVYPLGISSWRQLVLNTYRVSLRTFRLLACGRPHPLRGGERKDRIFKGVLIWKGGQSGPL